MPNCACADRARISSRWSDFLAAEFRKKTLAEWHAYLATLDVCYGRVNTLPEALAHPNLLARGMIRRDESGPASCRAADPFSSTSRREPMLREPALGEHTAAVLQAGKAPE